MPHETVPADIAVAIETALSAANDYGRRFDIPSRKREDAARAALDTAILKHLRNATDRTDVFVPWDFKATDCLHGPGFEAECQCVGCPRRDHDPAPADTGGISTRMAGA